jgi:hypothetical protein
MYTVNFDKDGNVQSQVIFALLDRTDIRGGGCREGWFYRFLYTAIMLQLRPLPLQVLIPYERVASRPPNNQFCQAKFTFCPNSSGERWTAGCSQFFMTFCICSFP